MNLTSIREARRGDIIKHILEFGRPVIIASDVNPLPKMIERLAASLGSKVFYPEVSLTNVEKEKIINDFKEEIKNTHQKDALAAGLKAFKNYHGLFLKIEETLAKQNKEEIFDTRFQHFHNYSLNERLQQVDEQHIDILLILLF